MIKVLAVASLIVAWFTPQYIFAQDATEDRQEVLIEIGDTYLKLSKVAEELYGLEHQLRRRSSYLFAILSAYERRLESWPDPNRYDMEESDYINDSRMHSTVERLRILVERMQELENAFTQ